MAGDPTRLAIARRGKLVTFYRNGDPHYKVSHSQQQRLTGITAITVIMIIIVIIIVINSALQCLELRKQHYEP